MLAKQHIPGWAFDPKDNHPEVEFTTLEELQKSEWVRRWGDQPHFLRFSRTELHTQRIQQTGNPVNDRFYCNLIAEMPGNKDMEWWVVANIYGTMEEIVSLGLPEWVAPAPVEGRATHSPVCDTPVPSVDSLIANGTLEFVTPDRSHRHQPE